MQEMDRIRDYRDIEEGIKQLLMLDPRLQAIVDAAGELPLRLEPPGFASLVRIIVGQQVSVASAAAIHGRLVEKIVPVSPRNFLEAGPDGWRQIGLSRPKQASLCNLCEAVLDQSLDLDQLNQLSAEQAIAALTQIKGIGPWTAEVYLMFCAGHRDIFPAGDRALQVSVSDALGMAKTIEEKHLRELAGIWQPYRSVASRLFWAYYRTLKSGRDAIPL